MASAGTAETTTAEKECCMGTGECKCEHEGGEEHGHDHGLEHCEDHGAEDKHKHDGEGCAC